MKITIGGKEYHSIEEARAQGQPSPPAPGIKFTVTNSVLLKFGSKIARALNHPRIPVILAST